MASPLDHGESFVLLEKQRVSDGMGGYVTEYTKTLEFTALMTLDSSVEARLAAQSGVVDNYSVFVEKSFPIESGDYFVRKSDDAVFRATSNPEENAVPNVSSMDVKSFTAQRAVIPTS